LNFSALIAPARIIACSPREFHFPIDAVTPR
jgi:hypothetical protein